MTTVRIKLSQAVVDTEHALQAANPVVDGDPGSLAGFFGSAVGDIGQEYAIFTSWELSGSTLRTTYSNGASEIYSGLVQDNPGAERGHASVTGYLYSQPGVINLSMSGRFDYDYAISGSTLTVAPSSQGMSIKNIRIATQLPSTDPDYDPNFGNVKFGLDGELELLSSGEMRGSVTSITTAADKFLQSSIIEGQFQLASSPFSDRASFEGTLTGYRGTYHDGSYVSLGDTAAFLRNGESVEAALYRGSDGRDDFSLDLPARLYQDIVIAAAAGDDLVSVKGGGGRVSVVAGEGNDVVTLLGDKQIVDGGRGLDIVKLNGARADFAVKAVPVPANPDPRTPPPASFTVTDQNGAASSLVNVERLVFSDATLALDIEGNAGQIYRLYQAAFDRTPDSTGLGYWIHAMDKGASLVDLAASFLAAPEGVQTYGGNLSTVDLVTRFYRNILDRDPDTGGRDYWAGLIDRKAATVAQVLAGISESNENKIGLVGVIGNGFVFTPWEQG